MSRTAIHTTAHEAAACPSPCDTGGSSNGHPPSFDFRRKHALDWTAIEMELANLSTRIAAVELLGRTAIDSVHGEKMVEVFLVTADDLPRCARYAPQGASRPGERRGGAIMSTRTVMVPS